MDFEKLKAKLAAAAGDMKNNSKAQEDLMQDPSFVPGESLGLAGLMGAAGKLTPDPINVPGVEFNGKQMPGISMDPGSVMGSMKMVGGANDALKGLQAANELNPQQAALKAVDPSASMVNPTMDQLRMITQKKSRLMDLLQKNKAAR